MNENARTDFVDAAAVAYVEAQLWAQLYGEGDNQEPLQDHGFDLESVDPHYFAHVRADIAGLFEHYADDIETYLETVVSLGDRRQHMSAGQFGHDYYLTREGHGVGFWDRGLGELGDRLATMADDAGGAASLSPGSEFIAETGDYAPNVLYADEAIAVCEYRCPRCDRNTTHGPWYGTYDQVAAHIRATGHHLETDTPASVEDTARDALHYLFRDSAADAEREGVTGDGVWRGCDIDPYVEPSGHGLSTRREVAFIVLGHRLGFRRYCDRLDSIAMEKRLAEAVSMIRNGPGPLVDLAECFEDEDDATRVHDALGLLTDDDFDDICALYLEGIVGEVTGE